MVIVLRPISHTLATLALTLILFTVEGEILILLPVYLFFGIVLGVGIDIDHLFHALIFNRKIALGHILSFNLMNLYRDYLNGRILKGVMSFDQQVIYSTFHLIWMIVVNLLISLYFPTFIRLSLLVTSVHYLMDLFALYQKYWR